MGRPSWGWVLVGAVVMLQVPPGCLSSESETLDTADEAEAWDTQSEPRSSIVALLDSGVNPYHPVFRWKGTSGPSEMFGRLPGFETVHLSFDLPYEDAVEKDGLRKLQRGTLYWFEGTRILAYSFDEKSADYHDAVVDEDGHGTAVASLVAITDPDSWLLVVESFFRNDEALRWVASQPWVDVVSISAEFAANLPADYLGPYGVAIADGLLEAAGAGKIVATAAGNEASPTVASPYSGPPWVLSIGGAVSTNRGESAFAAKLPSFVSEYVARGGAHKTTENEWATFTGTSFSTPIVAGVVSRAIYEVREAWGYSGNIQDGALAINGDKRLTNADLRLALNRTAVYWETTDYNPEPDTSCTLCPIGRATLPILPTPWVQMGWGFVNESIVPDLVAVLLGEKPLPDKPAEAVAYMDAVYEVRAEYWNLPRPRWPFSRLGRPAKGTLHGVQGNEVCHGAEGTPWNVVGLLKAGLCRRTFDFHERGAGRFSIIRFARRSTRASARSPA